MKQIDIITKFSTAVESEMNAKQYKDVLKDSGNVINAAAVAQNDLNQ